MVFREAEEWMAVCVSALGVFTLEGFGFAADPVNRRLLPAPALLK